MPPCQRTGNCTKFFSGTEAGESTPSILNFFCHLQELDHTHGATFTLVFLCSKVTSVPHQIGFKQFRRSSEDLETEEVTAPDHRVELNGHVVGIALDHSGRYLFANVRR